MALNQIDSIHDYIDFLHGNPSEVENLYKDLLIGVTSFFRDKEVFESIGDAPSLKFVDRCREFIQEGAPKDWDGVYRFKVK